MNGKKKSKEQALLLKKQQEIKQKIGEKIRRIREQSGISQESFANQHDIDRAQLGRIERGADIKISTLVKVLTALGIPLEDFFIGFDE